MVMLAAHASKSGWHAWRGVACSESAKELRLHKAKSTTTGWHATPLTLKTLLVLESVNRVSQWRRAPGVYADFEVVSTQAQIDWHNHVGESLRDSRQSAVSGETLLRELSKQTFAWVLMT